MNILTFVDPSPRGEWALRITADLAGRLAHRVVLLATRVDAAADPGLLDRAASAVGALEAVVVEKKVRAGRPRQVILDEARENPYEMTIFPPAGRNTLQRLLHGSRIRSVVRRIPSSVLVARRPAARIRRILAAVSASSFGRTTVGVAAEVARALEAEVTVLHVVSGIAIPAGARHSEKEGSTEGEARVDVSRRLQEMGRSFGVEPKVIIREGMVVEEVIDEVDAGAYDLLVVGHHSPEGADLQQDLTERILLWSPISVLVVQQPRPRPGE